MRLFVASIIVLILAFLVSCTQPPPVDIKITTYGPVVTEFKSSKNALFYQYKANQFLIIKIFNSDTSILEIDELNLTFRFYGNFEVKTNLKYNPILIAPNKSKTVGIKRVLDKQIARTPIVGKMAAERVKETTPRIRLSGTIRYKRLPKNWENRRRFTEYFHEGEIPQDEKIPKVDLWL